MPQKKPIKREVVPEVPTPALYPLADRKDIEALAKVTHPSKDQMDLIFSLYQKYVNPRAKGYDTTCSCVSSISNIYWQLIKFFKENKTMFE